MTKPEKFSQLPSELRVLLDKFEAAERRKVEIIFYKAMFFVQKFQNQLKKKTY